MRCPISNVVHVAATAGVAEAVGGGREVTGGIGFCDACCFSQTDDAFRNYVDFGHRVDGLSPPHLAPTGRRLRIAAALGEGFILIPPEAA